MKVTINEMFGFYNKSVNHRLFLLKCDNNSIEIMSMDEARKLYSFIHKSKLANELKCDLLENLESCAKKYKSAHQEKKSKSKSNFSIHIYGENIISSADFM